MYLELNWSHVTSLFEVAEICIDKGNISKIYMEILSRSFAQITDEQRTALRNKFPKASKYVTPVELITKVTPVFETSRGRYIALHSESSIRATLQTAIRDLINSGGIQKQYSADGGCTYFSCTYPSVDTQITIILNRGKITINLGTLVRSSKTEQVITYYQDAILDPVSGNIRSDVPGFLDSELEQIQTAIDRGELKDYYDKHYIRHT